MKEKLNHFMINANNFVSENGSMIFVGAVVGTLIFKNYVLYKCMMKQAENTFQYVYRFER